MTMRVTSNAQIERSLYDITSVGARLQRVQQDLSTGVRLHRPSDDPASVARSLVLKKTMAQNSQYLKNIQAASGFVQVSNTAASNYIDVLQRLRNLAIQGANGSYRTEDKAAILQEVSQLRDELRTIANTQYEGRYVFGGIKTDQQPFPSDVTLSPADRGNLSVEIAPGVTVNYNITSPDMFGDTTNGSINNIFSVIDNFSTYLSSGTSTSDISKDTIASIDSWIKTASSNRTSLAGLANRFDMAEQRFTQNNTLLEGYLNDNQATDIAQASLQLNQNQATLQAALEVGSKALPLSLVDFLR